MTTTTMATASAMVLNTSSIEALIVLGRVVDELDRHALRAALALIAGSSATTAAGGVERVGRRRREDADEGAGLAVEGDDCCRAPRRRARRAPRRAAARPSSPVAAQRQRAERLRRLQRRLHGDVVGDELVLGLAGRREEVRGVDRGQHVGGGDAARGELDRVDPDPHRVVGGADDLRPRRRPRSSTCAAGSPARGIRSAAPASCSGSAPTRYISAKSMPVPLTITGSSASSGSWPRTCCTLDSTSVSATSGSEPSSMLHADDARPTASTAR